MFFGQKSHGFFSQGESGISIPKPTPKLPLFNYISFIKALLFHKIEQIVGDALININKQLNTSTNKHLVLQELLKAFMNQTSSLKIMSYDLYDPATILNIVNL